MATPEVLQVDVGDLVFAPGGWLQVAGDIEDLVVVEVEAGHRVVRLRPAGLLFQPNHGSLAIELDDAVAFGIGHVVAEHRRPGRLGGGALEGGREPLPVIDVVAKHQGGGIVADELPADHERLGQAVGFRLGGVRDGQAPLRTVSQELAKTGRVVRRGNDQQIPNAGQHEHADRVIDHGLVVDRQQLLAHDVGQRLEPGTGAAGQHDALGQHQRIP